MLNAIKTDLRLLLECLKYQMKCPDSQKQALLTITSICQKNGQNVEFFKEIGGITFVYNLSRSIHYSGVKETALFTLASLAEINESCKQALCKEETFCDLAECMKHEVPLTLKRVAVYMLCALVSNNRQGQSFAKTSGCVNILLRLFRDSFPVSVGPNGLLPLWTSVSSALCGCVNNPQNEENQHTCMCVFPLIKAWLLQVSVSREELVQPICSFTGMTVANNAHAQEYFVSVGGLVILSDILAKIVLQCKDNAAACKLGAMITRTLSACIAENEALAPVISEMRVVPDLLLLLSSPNICPRDQLVVVLTIGHFTDACVEHQSQLLLGGGLPLLISLLSETNDEEVRKATIFVLQTCKKIMEPLGGSISNQNEDCDLQRHWQSAQEILQRIQHLEKRHLLGDKELVKDTEKSPDRHTQTVLLRPAWPVECREELWEGPLVRKVKGQSQIYEEELDRENILHMYTAPTQLPAQHVMSQRMQNLELRVQRRIFKDSDQALNPMREEAQGSRKTKKEMVVEEKNGLQMRREEMMKRKNVEKTKGDKREEMMKMKSHISRDTNLVDWIHEHTHKVTYNKPPAEGDSGKQSPDIFKHPAPMKLSQQSQPLSEDELSLCSELLDSEIERMLSTPVVSQPSKLRCTGCVSGVNEVNSRSVSGVLHSCKCLCEFHLALQQAEDGYKKSLRHEHGIHTHALDYSISKHNSIEGEGRMGSTHRLNHCGTMRYFRLTPLKRPCNEEVLNMEKKKVSSHHKTVLDGVNRTEAKAGLSSGTGPSNTGFC